MGVHEVFRWLDSVTPTGDGKWMARCPAHDDHEPSLSVTVGKGGKLLLHCFAGCDYEAILRAIAERRRRGQGGGVSGPDRPPQRRNSHRPGSRWPSTRRRRVSRCRS